MQFLTDCKSSQVHSPNFNDYILVDVHIHINSHNNSAKKVINRFVIPPYNKVLMTMWAKICCIYMCGRSIYIHLILFSEPPLKWVEWTEFMGCSHTHFCLSPRFVQTGGAFHPIGKHGQVPAFPWPVLRKQNSYSYFKSSNNFNFSI